MLKCAEIFNMVVREGFIESGISSKMNTRDKREQSGIPREEHSKNRGQQVQKLQRNESPEYMKYHSQVVRSPMLHELSELYVLYACCISGCGIIIYTTHQTLIQKHFYARNNSL